VTQFILVQRVPGVGHLASYRDLYERLGYVWVVENIFICVVAHGYARMVVIQHPWGLADITRGRLDLWAKEKDSALMHWEEV
jgi:hypothetical protein